MKQQVVDDFETKLQACGCYNTAGDDRRLQAFSDLQEILNLWSNQMLLQQQQRQLTSLSSSSSSSSSTTEQRQSPGISLVPFGSYRLNVHTQDSDLDVLALSPPHCSRSEFFTSLVELLQGDTGISELHPIPTAYTPVVKFLLHGITIDLLFVRLNSPTKLLEHQSLPSSPSRNYYSIDDSDLVGLDEAQLRSINGARVSQRLLEIVPSDAHFRLVLRAVKGWARACGIQSNVLGFLGGINWAILVTWICIHHQPSSTEQQQQLLDPSTLLYLFFRTFATWKWPEPVMLEPPQSVPPPGVLQMPSWNPEANPRDGLHLMPILTPAYPTMNSSYSVGIPQLRRIQDELYRAAYVMEKSNGNVSLLFQRSGGDDFFHRHSNFVQVIISASNGNDLIVWSRFCETKLRLLISGLETEEVEAWPYSNFFADKTSKLHELYFFVGLRFAPDIEQVNLQDSTLDFLLKANDWEGRISGMDVKLNRILASELPSFVLGENGKVSLGQTEIVDCEMLL